MAGALDQIATETQWLRGEMPESIFAPRGNWRPPQKMIQIAERVLEIVQRPELGECLSMLEQYNTAQKTRERNKSPLLLSPHLFHIIYSVEMREATLLDGPALDQPPAEVRKHFQQVSAKTKDLADLLRKAPQPHVALADYGRDWGALFEPFPLLQSPYRSTTIVPLDCLLNTAAVSLELVGRKIQRSNQHRRPAKDSSTAKREQLRLVAAHLVARLFRERLGQPYHSHVATICTLISGIQTDNDYAKKAEKRKRERL